MDEPVLADALRLACAAASLSTADTATRAIQTDPDRLCGRILPASGPPDTRHDRLAGDLTLLSPAQRLAGRDGSEPTDQAFLFDPMGACCRKKMVGEPGYWMKVFAAPRHPGGRRPWM